jgi:hypothetical protein
MDLQSRVATVVWNLLGKIHMQYGNIRDAKTGSIDNNLVYSDQFVSC